MEKRGEHTLCAQWQQNRIVPKIIKTKAKNEQPMLKTCCTIYAKYVQSKFITFLNSLSRVREKQAKPRPEREREREEIRMKKLRQTTL